MAAVSEGMVLGAGWPHFFRDGSLVPYVYVCRACDSPFPTMGAAMKHHDQEHERIRRPGRHPVEETEE